MSGATKKGKNHLTWDAIRAHGGFSFLFSWQLKQVLEKFIDWLCVYFTRFKIFKDEVELKSENISQNMIKRDEIVLIKKDLKKGWRPLIAQYAHVW